MARPLTPDYIQKIAPYVPGKPVKEVEREYGVAGALKLASNENCLGTSPRAIEAIRAMATEAFLYPESTCPYVRPKLAAKLGVKPEQLVFGDGSHELLDLAVLAFVEPHQEVLTTDVTFAIYKLAAMSAGRAFREVPVRDMHYDLDVLADGIRPETKLIFVANPNNPTGTIFRRAAFEKFLTRVPEDVVLVMDEAYIEFVADPDFPDSLRYHDGKRRIFTTRTFSKIYGLAGLRIGYGIATPEMIGALEKVRPSFNVNSIAQAAAAAAIDDDDFVVRSREVAQAGVALVTRELGKMGVKTWPSHTNFVLADVARPAKQFFEDVIRRGVIIRPVGPTLVRITVGTPAQNERLLAALRGALG